MANDLSSIVEFSIDLKKQEAPEPLPPGAYVGVIRKAEVKESQRGTMYGAVSFHIGSDQFPADFKDGPEDGLTLIYRRVGLEDNPQARYGTKRFIEAIGAPLSKKIDAMSGSAWKPPLMSLLIPTKASLAPSSTGFVPPSTKKDAVNSFLGVDSIPFHSLLYTSVQHQKER